MVSVNYSIGGNFAMKLVRVGPAAISGVLTFLFFSWCLLSSASAACDGPSCIHGVDHYCLTLPSGDGVWIQANPYTRCEVKPETPRPRQRTSPVPYTTPAPKKQPVVPPSPYISTEERKAKDDFCISEKNRFNANADVWRSRCSTYIAGTPIARRCQHDKAILITERNQIHARCPQLPLVGKGD